MMERMPGGGSKALVAVLVVLGVAMVGVGIAGALGHWGQTTTVSVATGAGGTTASTTTTSSPPSTGAAVLPKGTSSTSASPSSSSSSSSSTTAAPGTTAGATIDARVTAFLDALAKAQHDHDVDFLMAHLNPAVIARYGDAQCRSYVAGVGDPSLKFVVKRVQPPADYSWEADGLKTVVPNTLAVDVDYTAKGETIPTTVHVTEVNGEFTWFADCGQPKP